MKPTKNSLLPYYTKIDLSNREMERHYEFPGDEEVVISEPQFLIVTDNGHRIFDKKGISHYIPYGWIHLWWENMPDRADRNTGFYCQEEGEEK
jgi:hypothetical protein